MSTWLSFHLWYLHTLPFHNSLPPTRRNWRASFSWRSLRIIFLNLSHSLTHNSIHQFFLFVFWTILVLWIPDHSQDPRTDLLSFITNKSKSFLEKFVVLYKIIFLATKIFPQKHFPNMSVNFIKSMTIKWLQACSFAVFDKSGASIAS